MNGSIIHHHENSNDKINAGIRVREKHSQYCFACIRNSISSQTSRYLYRVKKNQPIIKNHIHIFFVACSPFITAKVTKGSIL